MKPPAAPAGRAGVDALLLLLWPLAAAAGAPSAASSIVGEKAPALHVKVVAGHRAGEAYSITDAAAGNPLAVTFVSADNDMVADFARELDKWAVRHRKTRLTTALVFLGEPGPDEARLAEIAETRRLRLVSLAMPVDARELDAWKLDPKRPTNAYLVRNSKVVKHFAADCPFCDKLRGKIGTALWSMLAAGRESWGATAKSSTVRAISP